VSLQACAQRLDGYFCDSRRKPVFLELGQHPCSGSVVDGAVRSIILTAGDRQGLPWCGEMGGRRTAWDEDVWRLVQAQPLW
jgi:hypothetical protein